MKISQGKNMLRSFSLEKKRGNTSKTSCFPNFHQFSRFLYVFSNQPLLSIAVLSRPPRRPRYTVPDRLYVQTTLLLLLLWLPRSGGLTGGRGRLGFTSTVLDVKTGVFRSRFCRTTARSLATARFFRTFRKTIYFFYFFWFFGSHTALSRNPPPPRARVSFPAQKKK